MWPAFAVTGAFWLITVSNTSSSRRSYRRRKHNAFRLSIEDSSLGTASNSVETTTKPLLPAEFSPWWTDNETLPIELLQGNGFCNDVYRIPNVGILKVFSNVAKDRMKVSGIEIATIDRHVGNLFLGPHILDSSDNGILMEDLPGPCLTEAYLHSEEAIDTVIPTLAKSLAELHNFETLVDGCPNMLWAALEVLLDRIEDPKKKDYYQSQVEGQKKLLGAAKLPLVCGHGDCKPSNILYDNTNQIHFIDLEMAGCHYRGLDLAKLFRTSTPTPWTERNHLRFLELYLKGDGTKATSPKTSTEQLRQQANLLTPMTWLEAAIFFEAMGGLEDQAQNRRANYEIAKMKQDTI